MARSHLRTAVAAVTAKHNGGPLDDAVLAGRFETLANKSNLPDGYFFSSRYAAPNAAR
jgi:hypothetical protein